MKLRFQVLFFLTLVVLTSCGSSETSSKNLEPAKFAEESSVGTRGELIAIQSNNVNAAGYDATSMVMTVQFKNGALYEYYGVPPELWASFIAAQPHPWSKVGYPRLVQAGIAYKRLR